MNRFELYRQTPADMISFIQKIVDGVENPTMVMPLTPAEWEEWLMEEIDDQE